MKKILVITFCLLLTVMLRSFAQTTGTVYTHTLSEPEHPALTVISDIAVIAPAFAAFLTAHEGGHWMMYRLFGVQEAQFYFYRSYPGGGFAIGQVSSPVKLPPVQDALTNVSGVLFSRGLAEASDVVLRNVAMPKFPQKLFSVMYVMGKLDFSTYVLRNFLTARERYAGQDIEQFVRHIAGAGNDTGRILTYVGLLGLAGADIYFDWARIIRHVRVLGGEDYREVLAEQEQRLVHIGMDVRFGAPVLSISVHLK